MVFSSQKLKRTVLSIWSLDIPMALKVALGFLLWLEHALPAEM